MDEIDELAMMSDEDLMQESEGDPIDAATAMSEEELIAESGIDPSQLPEPIGQARGLQSMDRIADILGDVGTFGAGQHVAGFGAGLGAGVETFSQQEGQPFLERLGAAGEAFMGAYPEGRKDYNDEIAEVYAKATPEEIAAGTIPGLIGTAKFLPGVGTKGGLGRQTAETAGMMGTFGFLGSQGETIDEMALDGLSMAMYGAPLPVGVKALGYGSAKVSQAADFLWESVIKGGSTKVASLMQGIPTHTISQYAKLTDDQVKNYYKKAGKEAAEGQMEIIAKNITDGIRKGLKGKRDNLSARMTEELEAQFGSKKMLPEHIKLFQSKLGKLGQKLDETIPEEAELIGKIKKVEKLLAPKPVQVRAPREANLMDKLAGRGDDKGLTVMSPPTYEQGLKAYRMMKDWTKPSYKLDESGKVVGVNTSTETSRRMQKTIEGENGLKENFLYSGPNSEKIREINKEYTKIHNIRREASDSLIRKKGSTEKPLERAGRRKGKEFIDANQIEKFAPDLKLKSQAEEFAAMSALGEYSLLPESFAARAVAGSLLSGAGIVGALGDDYESATLLTLATLSSSPITTKLLLDSIRKGRTLSNTLSSKAPVLSKVGPSLDTAADMTKSLANSQNSRRIFLEELQKRQEESGMSATGEVNKGLIP